MSNLLRCRRGSVAFATVVALVPLIGLLALGAEAGSWYSTKQHAQNAADAAAYSGAVQQACLSTSSCNVSNTADYRAKEFAAQNAFCDASDTTTTYPGSTCAASLPTGISQSVQIASLTSWNGNSGTFIQATVSQQQPTYLASLLGLTTVTISASAVAKVNGLPKAPCVLALTGSIGFQGSPNINAPNCGMASNDPAANALNFTGGGMTINLGSLSAVGGCTGSSTFCSTALTYMPAPIADPFSALNGALSTMCGSNPTCGLPACAGSTLIAYSATSSPPFCTNNNLHITGNGGETLSPGGNTACPASASSCIYFISGALKITGTPVISGTAIFILLPGATIDNKGNATITITAPTTAPSASSLPAALQSNAALFQYMAIYDASNAAVQFGGNSNITVTGNIYAPTAAVTFQGNPTMSVSGQQGRCGELIAASVAFNGNATFDSTGCPSAEQPPSSQYVQLVQ